jgi:hypothetical protein
MKELGIDGLPGKSNRLTFLSLTYANLSILLFLLLFTGSSRTYSYQKTVYDDVSKISAQGDSYTFKSRQGEIGENQSVLKFDGFYGKRSLWEVELPNDDRIHMEIQTKIDKGRFKICVINDKNEVWIISENSVNETQELALQKGKYYICMVGDKAEGEMDMTLSADKNVELRPLDD